MSTPTPNTSLHNNPPHTNQFRRELQRLLRQPLVLIATLLQWLLTAWLLRGQLDNYLSLQAGGIRNLSVSNDLLTPVLGALTASVLLTAPLFASAMRAALQVPYRRLALASNARWLNPTLVAGSLTLLALPIVLLLHLALLRSASALSLWQLGTAAFGLLLLALLLLWLALWLSLQVRSIAAALALAYLAMAGLAALELQTLLPTPLGLFRVFRDGALSLGGLLSFALLLLLLWRAIASNRRAEANSKTRVIHLLLLLLALAAAWLPWRWQHQHDAALTAQEQQQLAQLPSDAHLLLVSADPERLRDYQATLSVLNSLQPQLPIVAKHPAQLSAAERDALPGQEGLLISVGGQSAWLKLPTAQMVKQTAFWLSRLQRRNEQFLVFLEGHGERRLFGDSPRDLNGLRQRLDTLGLRALSLPLQAGMNIPENTAALVLASPTSALPPADLQAIKQYLDRGGALLWLREPDEPAELSALAEQLGVQRLPGTILDLAGVQRGTPTPAIVLIDQYPKHPALNGLNSLSALPWTAALQFTPTHGFTGEQLLLSHSNTVLVNDPSQTEVPLNAARGPFAIGWALQRTLAEKNQRLIVLGDGHFVADTAIRNYGNGALAVALLQWLAFGDEAIAAVDERAADADLLPSAALLWWYRWGLPVLLPLLLLLVGTSYQWRWRR